MDWAVPPLVLLVSHAHRLLQAGSRGYMLSRDLPTIWADALPRVGLGVSVTKSDRSDAIAGLAVTCEAIAGGRFENIDRLFEIVSDPDVPDDIRGLAEAFAGMVVQVEAREFHASQLIADLKETQRQLEAAQQRLRSENSDLRQRLRKLEVRYDEAEASREVTEIAESDYFRALQQRAKSLRSKYKAKD